MMLASLAILVLLAAASPVLFRHGGRAAGVVGAAVLAGVGVWLAARGWATATTGGVLLESTPWATSLGVDLAFRLDGLSFIFCVLICFIGAMVILYAGSYMRNDPARGRFFATLLAFTAAMLGLVLADNTLLLFVFWELTSITSFLLIGHEHRSAAARRASMQALIVTGLGGLALLAGLILLGIAAGQTVGGSITFSLGDILTADLAGHAIYTPAVVLVLLGCFSKSAIVPLHFWLPNAMEAPSPVSALLHSSTMVKAGVYLIARLHPALGGTALWDDTLIVFGGITMLLAAYLATRKTKLKPVLAYSTISSLGALVMLIGMGAYKAAAVYLLAHAMFKAALFLVAGSVTKQTGEKDTERLGGLRRSMPVTFAAALLAALSLAGVFPLVGFVGKELILKAGLHHPEWSGPVVAATVVAAVLTVMAAAVVGLRPFIGPAPTREPDERSGAEPRDPPIEQMVGPIVLAVLGLVAGVLPAPFAEPLVRGVMSSLEGTPYDGEIDLAFWHMLWPVSIALGLSVFAVVGGLLLYRFKDAYRRITARGAAIERFGPEANYDAGLSGLYASADRLTSILQNGSLRIYIRVVLLATVAVAGAALVRTGMLDRIGHAHLDGITFLDAVLVLAIAVCAVGATRLQKRLAVITMLGVIGYVVALVFIFYGAPDVAATQFAVETLVVVIFVLVIYHLPQFKRLTGRVARLGDWLVASLLGATITAFALVSLLIEPASRVSEFHAERSVTEGYGRNIVNVILVDFRAFDTLGEVFVLGVAALGVYTLLRVRSSPSSRPAARSAVADLPRGVDTSDGDTGPASHGGGRGA